MEHLRKVFKVIRWNEIYVNKEKCSFTKKKVSFLGHRIKNSKLMMDKNKVKVMHEQDPSIQMSSLRYFFGLVNYYMWFIGCYIT